MDIDLAEAVEKLKDIFNRRSITTSFGKAQQAMIDDLRRSLRIPPRYRAFLQEADPVDVETVTPDERVRFIPSDRLTGEQPVVEKGWQGSWVVIARSALHGDLYFLDTSKPDAEGDCPVFSVATGAQAYRPALYAASFEQFLRTLTTHMEAAA